MVRIADAPAGMPITPGSENRIMHARLKVGDRLLMGGDAPSQFFSKPQGFSVNIVVDDPAEAERIFRELGDGGTVKMAIGETFWARRFGMLIDKFGTPWMVNCEKTRGAAETPAEPFTMSRTFDVPRELLWKCFTDADRMKHWWGPQGAKVTSSKMDLRPGGTYHYNLRMPDGTELLTARSQRRSGSSSSARSPTRRAISRATPWPRLGRSRCSRRSPSPRPGRTRARSP